LVGPLSKRVHQDAIAGFASDGIAFLGAVTPMRYKATIAALLAVFGIASTAQAQPAGIFDREWGDVQSRMQSEVNSRCGRLNPIRATPCRTDVRRSFMQQGLVPGTDEYVQRHYGSMDVQSLNQNIMRLNRTYGSARHFHVGEPSGPGEVSYEMIEYDINAIRRLIEARGGLPPR